MTYLHWRGWINQQCTSACTSQNACFQQAYNTSCKLHTNLWKAYEFHCTLSWLLWNLAQQLLEHAFLTRLQIVCSDSAVLGVKQEMQCFELLQWSLVTATLNCGAQSYSPRNFLWLQLSTKHSTDTPQRLHGHPAMFSSITSESAPPILVHAPHNVHMLWYSLQQLFTHYTLLHVCHFAVVPKCWH